MRYVLATALGVSAALCAGPALARDTNYRIEIGAVDATAALATLSAQTGISFASDGPLPRRAVRPVRGKMTVDEALDRILAELDLRAERVGARAYRIVRRKGEGEAARVPVAYSPPPPAEDIIITGRKRPEMVSDVAATVAVYVPDAVRRSGAAATTLDVADNSDGLTLTNGGPGYGRLFIRGVADSPFNSFSQSTVSVQLDDTRVTFDAPEPALRLVDIARVEVLKGPQGPLYGTGALGGVYRIVTNRPLLGRIEGAANVGASSVSGGGSGVQADGMINLPVIRDRLAVRVAGYTADDPGWIDDVKGGRNLNRSLTRGVRVALRAAPFDGWTVDLGGLLQSIDAKDSQYVDSPDQGQLRDLAEREPRLNKIAVVQGSIAGSIGGLRLTISAGLTVQRQNENFDATASAAVLGLPTPVRYFGTWEYHVFDQEVRIASPLGSRITWVAGISYLRSSTSRDALILAGPLSGDGTFPRFETLLVALRRVSEAAIYADGTVPLSSRLRLGIGVRGFRAGTEDQRFVSLFTTTRARTLLGITPNASLSYQISPDQLIYARFATAFRPGGIDPDNAVTRRYDADEVSTVDFGGRIRLGGSLRLDGSLFLTDWRNMQADYLQENGLIETRNAGRATIFGTELSADWRPGNGWRLEAGAIWQRPRLARAADGTNLAEGVQLPVVPDISARLTLARDMDVRGWTVTPSVAANFVGAARLSIDPRLDRRMPAYVVGRVGIAADRGRLTLRLAIDNLFGTTADTFSFGNPFSVWTSRQYTPYRPRSFSFSMSRRF